jgi:FtsP/CotA-like multicopper oxidase with cupredoxin domain
MTRRNLLKLCAAVGAGLAVSGLGSGAPAGAFGRAAQSAATPMIWLPLVELWPGLKVLQTPLPGASIARFVEPLPVFGPAGGGAAPRVAGTTLTVAAKQFQQKVLPAGFYAQLTDPVFQAGTWVWGYQVGAQPARYPGTTIEAQRNTAITVTYFNDLPAVPVLQKYLTVDQTIHWADPLNQMGSRAPYSGPPPLVTHLHGGEVASTDDGNPLAWFTPGAAGQRLAGKGFVTNVYHYPNAQEATTLWYHDHALGAARLNVYAGLAGFYLLRDQYDTGAPASGLNLPAGAYEIEMMIQDRQFDTNGQWLFPAGPMGGLQGPPPDPARNPYWIPMFLGDVMVVNGKSWPYLAVEPRRYRLRILNGCNARVLELRLVNRDTQARGPAFWQIGSDGGLLDRPVMLKDPANASGLRLLMSPAERADIIVDFAGYQGQTLRLANSALAPYPNGSPPDPQTTGQVMEFRVGSIVSGGSDTSFNPAAGGALRGGTSQPPPIVHLSAAPLYQKRQLTLVETPGPNGPTQKLLNNTQWDGSNPATGIPVPGSHPDGLGDWVTELPRIGSTELWEIINLTGDAHPIHLHLVQFQLANRQACGSTDYQIAWAAAFGQPGGASVPAGGPPLPYTHPNLDGALGGNPAFSSYLQGAVIPPDPNETGWKDTVRMYPGQVTRILVRWAPQDVPAGSAQAGQNLYPFDPTVGPGYVWHCHMIDHEDNEMMRPWLPVK